MKTNLAIGIWIIFISGCLFIVSLFLEWASVPGFLVFKGISFMQIDTSLSSGLPQLNLITLVTTITCMLLCLPFMKGQNARGYRNTSISQIILSILGILPFILLPFEIKTWLPSGTVEFGGWLAIVSVFGLLIGAIVHFTKIRQEYKITC